VSDQPLSLRERKKRQNRDSILEAARDLFQSQGFDETSIDEIAARAAVSRGTLFNYFPGKEALLEGIANQELDWLAHRVGTDLASAPTAVARIRHTMRMLVSDTLPFMQVTRYVFLVALQQSSGTGQGTSSLRLANILQELVIEAQAHGEIRPDLDPGEIAHAITGAYMAALFSWIAAASTSSPTSMQMVENIVNMLFKGIAGPQYRGEES
jgi:AcrR family transcriptional regulator